MGLLVLNSCRTSWVLPQGVLKLTLLKEQATSKWKALLMMLRWWTLSLILLHHCSSKISASSWSCAWFRIPVIAFTCNSHVFYVYADFSYLFYLQDIICLDCIIININLKSFGQLPPLKFVLGSCFLCKLFSESISNDWERREKQTIWK